MAARFLLLIVAAGLLAGPVAACGSSSSLPTPPACAAASVTPLVPSTPANRQQAGRDYLASVQSMWSGLQRLYQDFRLAHPNDNFSRDSEFRPAVARFIDNSICTVRAFLAMQAPSTRLQQRYQQLYPLLDDYVAHLQAGREAIRTRNVTGYRAFYDALEGKMEAIRRASVG